MYNNKSKHRFQNSVFSQLNGRAILYHPRLRDVFGDVNSAIWFSQILYWYDKSEKGKDLRKSRSQITTETGLSRDQQIRVEDKLKRLGVVKITVKPGRPSPINHIVIDFDSLVNVILNLRGIRILKDSEEGSYPTSNTENISKNTQKNIKITKDNYFKKRNELIYGKSV